MVHSEKEREQLTRTHYTNPDLAESTDTDLDLNLLISTTNKAKAKHFVAGMTYMKALDDELWKSHEQTDTNQTRN